MSLPEWTDEEVREAELRCAEQLLQKAIDSNDERKIEYRKDILRELKSKMGWRGKIRRILRL